MYLNKKDLYEMVILTTGILSGFGKYVYENLGGIGITRSSSREDLERMKNKGVDIIVHCAFNLARGLNSENLYRYIEDNVFLTKEMVSIPHKKFIFLSSVDVYPKTNSLHTEEEIIDMDSVNGIYGITKLISESIVKNYSKNYLILRPTAFLGKYSRRNSLIKILDDEKCVLTLLANSRFNYILYSDVLGFIRFSIQDDLKGIYNLASSENISLKEIADLFGKRIKFGEYFYDVGNIDNKKIASILPNFKKTSKEVIIQFAKERAEKFCFKI